MGESEKTTIAELKTIMVKSQVPTVDWTIIQPWLILGGITSAKNTELLTKLAVTHIINMAYDPTGKGNFIYVDTNEEYYEKRNFPCKYLGIRAIDTPRYKISKFFEEVAQYIEDARNEKGIVYIHCYMGISRSAIMVLAYLVRKHNMSAKEAVTFVRNKREIFPNDGFLDQLLELAENIKKI